MTLESERYHQAHNILNNAVCGGTATVPSRCSICNEKRKLCAHHEDYSKPLAVTWVCYPCHKRVFHPAGDWDILVKTGVLVYNPADHSYRRA